jgi:nucleoside-diphosphate-sugar epimerase
MQRVLITGGTGMLGANLARQLVADGFHVSVFARPQSKHARLQAIEDALVFERGDLTDANTVRAAVDRARPDIVYHLASTAFNAQSTTAEDHFRVNVLGTLYLLEALKDSPDSVLVYTGTGAVYQARAQSGEQEPLQPATVLGASKAAAATLLQTYARLHGLHTVELRLFMPYGPWEHPRRLIPQTILAALDGRDLPMSQGEQQRDLVFVDDVVAALRRAGTARLAPGTVINIGSGVGVPIKDVVALVFALTGTKARPLLGALPTRKDEIMVMSADIRKARAELSWEPRTTLEQGLRKTINWVRANRGLLHELN